MNQHLPPTAGPVSDALVDIIAELDRAVTKFPTWPSDIIHASTVVTEESGELAQAALQYVYEGGDLDKARKEAVQTAVTAIRFIISHDDGNYFEADAYTSMEQLQHKQDI